ncbi:hypothetical protein [Burkholderia sp. Bp8995]|uniref:hypothetical protein n=1 Tax=Burkholderia sp. Bp8995 TaxID=2184556 RepID=UPI001628F194|nr:hypothetical protein [Burkholderia sp. Bp8995]
MLKRFLRLENAGSEKRVDRSLGPNFDDHAFAVLRSIIEQPTEDLLKSLHDHRIYEARFLAEATFHPGPGCVQLPSRCARPDKPWVFVTVFAALSIVPACEEHLLQVIGRSVVFLREPPAHNVEQAFAAGSATKINHRWCHASERIEHLDDPVAPLGHFSHAERRCLLSAVVTSFADIAAPSNLCAQVRLSHTVSTYPIVVLHGVVR